MKILLKKVLRELFQNKSRTFFSFIAIVVGIFAFGSFLVCYTVINRDLPQIHKLQNAHSLVLEIDDINNSKERIMTVLDNSEAVALYELRGNYRLRIRSDKANSRDMELFSFEDIKTNNVDIASIEDGKFAKNDTEIMFERLSLPFIGDDLGGTISIETTNGQEHQFTTVGTVHDVNQDPANYHGEVYGYIPHEGLQRMGLALNQVVLLVSGDRYDRGNIQVQSKIIIDELEAAGIKVDNVNIPSSPGESPHNHEYMPVTLILQAIGTIIYVLAFFLIVNMLNTILVRQTRQIGVIKALGGKTITIFFVYLFMVLIFVGTAVIFSVPASIAFGQYLTGFLLGLGNYEIVNPSLPPLVFIILIGSSFLLPVGVCFMPILRNCKLPPKKSLYGYGIEAKLKNQGLLFQLLCKFQLFSQPVNMALRNVYRNARRITVSIIILALGGVVFLTVSNTINSFDQTVDNFLDVYDYQYELRVNLNISNKNVAEMEALLSSTQEIKRYEIWSLIEGTLLTQNDQKGKEYNLQVPIQNSNLYRPILQNGRWFQQNDTNSGVITNQFLEEGYGYEIGDTISFNIDDQKYNFEIIGIVDELEYPNIYLAPGFIDSFSRPGNLEKIAKIDLVRTDKSAIGMQASQIEKTFENAGYKIINSAVSTEHIEITEETNKDTLGFLINAAILTVIAGGIGLASTMSIQVMDRTKEIGILKSIGAKKNLIFRIIISESILIGLMSLIVSIIISFPATFLSNYLFGDTFLNVSLVSVFELQPFLTWAGYLLIVTFLAAIIPAKTAAQVKEKEALLYE